MDIIRAPGGGWERDPATNQRGRQLWHNRRGRRVLTNYARNSPLYQDWQDIVLHIPVLEQQIGPADGHRPFDATVRSTHYPVSNETLPGMLDELMDSIPLGGPRDLEYLTTLPQDFKDWVLDQLVDGDGDLVEVGSDRSWTFDNTGSWYLSVQYIDAAGELSTVLPDRPMLGTVLLYDDIQYHWHLSRTAAVETDCVALSLAEVFDLDLQETKERLRSAAALLGEDPNLGFTRAAVKGFLEDHSNRTGADIGWKIFQCGQVVDEMPQKNKHDPYLAFTQRANHLYLYKNNSALSHVHAKPPRTTYVDLREFERDLSCIPYEMLSRFQRSESYNLTLWEFKKERQTKEESTPELE